MNSNSNNSIRRAFTLVELLIVIGIIAILASITVPAVQSMRSAARRTQCQNNQRQLGLAFTMYAGEMGGYPASVSRYPAQRGWVTDLLPFLDAGNFSDDWDVQYDYFDNQNKRLLHKRLPLLNCPQTPNAYRTMTAEKDMNNKPLSTPVSGISSDYFVHYGGIQMTDGATYKNALQECDKGCGSYFIPDGLSNTIVLNEQCGRPDLWIGNKKQSGQTVDESWRSLWGAGPSTHLAGFAKNSLDPGFDRVINVSNNGIYSFHSHGAHALFMDGSVRFISEQALPWIVLALNTSNGKENVTPEDLSLTCFDESFVDPKTGKYPDGTTPK